MASSLAGLLYCRIVSQNVTHPTFVSFCKLCLQCFVFAALRVPSVAVRMDNDSLQFTSSRGVLFHVLHLVPHKSLFFTKLHPMPRQYRTAAFLTWLPWCWRQL